VSGAAKGESDRQDNSNGGGEWGSDEREGGGGCTARSKEKGRFVEQESPLRLRKTDSGAGKGKRRTALGEPQGFVGK